MEKKGFGDENVKLVIGNRFWKYCLY
jgi:hypothetical protein